MSKGRYCGPCFEEKVNPEIEKYYETMRRAKQVNVFTKTQTKETRLVKRSEKPIRVECWDREEALLRLGFEAARAGFNGLVDVDVIYEKVRDHAYQTTRWIGVGIPAHLNPDRPGWT